MRYINGNSWSHVSFNFNLDTDGSSPLEEGKIKNTLQRVNLINGFHFKLRVAH